MPSLGFGCNQAFLRHVVSGLLQREQPARVLIDRADLLCVLLAMAATFALMTPRAPAPAPRGRGRGLRLLLRCRWWQRCTSSLRCIALRPASRGSRLPGPWRGWLPASRSRSFCASGAGTGEASIDQSVPEVFIGSALGAAVCFFVVAIPVEGAYIPLYVLPVGSAWALRALGEPDGSDDEPAAADDPTEEAAKLSGRIIAGTVVYGHCHGAVEVLVTSAEGGSRVIAFRHLRALRAVLRRRAAASTAAVRSRWACAPCCPRGPIRRWGRSAARIGSPSCLGGGRICGGSAGPESCRRLRRGRGARRLSGGLLGARLAVPHHGPHRPAGTRRAPSPGASRRCSRARSPACSSAACSGRFPAPSTCRRRSWPWPAWRSCTRICSCSLTATWQRSRWSSPRATVSRRPASLSRGRQSSRSARRRSCRSPCAAAPPSASPASSSSRRTPSTRTCAASTPSAACTRARSSSTRERTEAEL